MAQAKMYYLSPDGDDEAAGTREAPWRSLQQANERLAPGDTVVLLDGEYEGTISPARSGEEGAPITYRAENSGRAILRGKEGSPAIVMADREYVVVEGFHVLPMAGSGWMKLEGTRYITVRNCTFEATRGFIIECNECHYNRYEGNRILRSLRLTKWGHTGGDMWNNVNCSHCVFEGNYFSRCGHRPLGFLRESPYNVVRGNVFDGRWCRNFEFFSTPLMLIEGNVITNGFDGSGSADGRAKLFIVDSIFRRNLIFRNWYMPLVINSYHYPGFPAPFAMLNSRLYNNTWYRNHDGAFEMADYSGEGELEHYVDGNIFANNIFFDNDPGGGHLALVLHKGIGSGNRWLNNAICGDRPGRRTIHYDNTYPRVGDWPGTPLTATEANQHVPAQFEGNIDVDPRFVDADADDYRLRDDSPCRDAGRPLARAVSTGSGRLLRVDDARWFYDGFGIPGEQGDLIVVGERRQIARVVSRDLEANMLVLDRDLRWREGDAVTLPYVGDAPDLGAYEIGAEGEEWYRPPVVPDGLRLVTMETATEPTVVVGFEEEDREDWHYLWNFSRQKGTDARLDEETAYSGERSMRVYATDDGAIMACDIRPRWWDIDRFPYARFAYRIPEGVPVGIFLYAFASPEWGRGAVCVGGSPTHEVGGYPHVPRYELIDDGQWHEITVDVRTIREVYPKIKLLKMFRFYTLGNGKQGDQYWFDDFVILPAEAEQ